MRLTCVGLGDTAMKANAGPPKVAGRIETDHEDPSDRLENNNTFFETRAPT
jgi:hypothetical protein